MEKQNLQKHLSNIVVSSRGRLAMSQEELVERSGVSKKTINSIETSVGNPRFDTLYKLVRTLELDANLLFNMPSSTINPVIQRKLSSIVEGLTEKQALALLDSINPIVSLYKNSLSDQSKK